MFIDQSELNGWWLLLLLKKFPGIRLRLSQPWHPSKFYKPLVRRGFKHVPNIPAGKQASHSASTAPKLAQPGVHITHLGYYRAGRQACLATVVVQLPKWHGLISCMNFKTSSHLPYNVFLFVDLWPSSSSEANIAILWRHHKRMLLSTISNFPWLSV